VLPKRSAGFQTCCIADIHVGSSSNCTPFALCRFGNLRYGRLGSLRYPLGQHARAEAPTASIPRARVKRKPVLFHLGLSQALISRVYDLQGLQNIWELLARSCLSFLNTSYQ
jgi:hypothetical protein